MLVDEKGLPIAIGWCVEMGIEHNWRHPVAHSFMGPKENEYARYCINCGCIQSRTPPITTPASDWQDVDKGSRQ